MKPISVIANSSLAVTDTPEPTEGTEGSDAETYSMRLWRLGRRINRKDDALLTLGHFTFELDLNQNPIGKPLTERSRLSLTDATLRRTLTFKDDIQLEETTFVVRSQPIVALQRSVANRGSHPATVAATFTYTFDGADGRHEHEPQGVNITLLHTGVSCACFEYRADTIRTANGMLSIKTTQPNVRPQTRGNAIAFPFHIPLEPQATKTITFYIFPCDQIDAENYMGMAYQLKNSLRTNAFQRLTQEHLLVWHDWWKNVSLILPNPRLITVYRAAIYHLLCASAPKAGIPDGLSSRHNQARYNGLSELFAVDALLHAGFPQQAKQPTMFRQATLPRATITTQANRTEANFPLWTDETGAPAGPGQAWPATTLSHNAHIALAAWHVALHTRDRNFLRQHAYPVIRAIAQFFTHAVIPERPQTQPPEDERLTIIPCLDFPGNGTYTDKPIGTTYAVAATLEAATQAAIELQQDDALRTTWSSLARKLLKTLTDRQNSQTQPADCKHPLAPLAHIFPYARKYAQDPDLLEKLNALAKHLMDCPAPDGTLPPSPWAGAWIAATAARLKQADLAEQAILETAQFADDTGQLPKRRDPQRNTHLDLPWFIPAQATYITALTLMLIQTDNREIQLMPATPTHWRDLDVTLPASGGLLVTFKVRNLSLTKLSITNQTDQNAHRLITIPPHIKLPHPLNSTRSYSIPPLETIRIF